MENFAGFIWTKHYNCHNVPFDGFNASLLNKSTNYFKKSHTDAILNISLEEHSWNVCPQTMMWFWCVPQLPRSWTSWTGLSLWRGSSLKTVVRTLRCAGRCSAAPPESPDTTQVKLFCRKACCKPQYIHFCQQTLSVSCSLSSHKVESAQQDWPVWCEETPVVSAVTGAGKTPFSLTLILLFSPAPGGLCCEEQASVWSSN